MFLTFQNCFQTAGGRQEASDAQAGFLRQRHRRILRGRAADNPLPTPGWPDAETGVVHDGGRGNVASGRGAIDNLPHWKPAFLT